jgi:hypothetical protein
MSRHDTELGKVGQEGEVLFRVLAKKKEPFTSFSLRLFFFFFQVTKIGGMTYFEAHLRQLFDNILLSLQIAEFIIKLVNKREVTVNGKE